MINSPSVRYILILIICQQKNNHKLSNQIYQTSITRGFFHDTIILTMNQSDKEPVITYSDDDDDSSTCSDFTNYVSYASMPEWKDITPITIRSETSIMDLTYTPKFEEAFSYLRAVIAKDELSERAFRLTAECIDLQRSNFTVWYFRRRILKKLPHLYKDELAFVAKSIESEPKNYQVWHHRKTIVEWLNDPSQELEFTKSLLNIDCKNYHSWQHRQWVVKKYNLFDLELQYTKDQIDIDLRNNSAWNHRFFVIKQTGYCKNKDNFLKEKLYVQEKITIVPGNESSWSYLRGLLLLIDGGISKDLLIHDFAKRLSINSDRQEPQLLSFLFDMNYEKTIEAEAKQDANLVNEYKDEAKKLISQLLVSDKVRSKYWSYKLALLDNHCKQF